MMASRAQAERVLGAVEVHLAANLPPGVSRRQLDRFVRRHRPQLVDLLLRALIARAQPPAEHWTPGKRTRANLAAMALLSKAGDRTLTDAERRIVAAYSGWGGLSIDAVRDRFPAGFPAPETRGLIHEYYTPSAVTREVARVLEPLLPDLRQEGRLRVLEPAAGIGRFLAATAHWPDVDWHVVEYSDLSARMLQARFPDVDVYAGPFERWVREHAQDVAGTVDLVLANPPYGARGAALTEDPDRTYREKQAYAYFLRRALDLLRAGGLGVFLVPAGFLTGRARRTRALREAVLQRHHLAAAYRLPSGLFPGAMLVTDLLFFRSRGGALAAVDEADQFIVDGRYFERFPTHILGEEVGRDGGEDDQTRRARWGYQVVGTFERLPDLVERPLCEACVLATPTPRPGRSVARPAPVVEDLSPALEAAVALGERVDRYLAAVATEESAEAVGLWRELHDALTAWNNAHGNPHAHVALRALVKRGIVGAERFVAAFTRSGRLIRGLARAPVYAPRYAGGAHDVAAQAAMLYRTERSVPVGRLLAFHRDHGGALRSEDELLDALLGDDWALDEGHVLPMEGYLSGHLWPRLDRARSHAGEPIHDRQARRLLDAIGPVVFDDIDGVSPRQGWIPLELVQAWLTETLNAAYGPVSLVRRDGLVQLSGVDYDDIDGAALAPETRWCIGWMNHDKTVFKPRKRRHEDLDEKRLAIAREWDRAFRAWVGADEARRTRVEDAYNRTFRGYVPPRFSDAPLPIARWDDGTIRLHPHQAAGARRLLHHRGGLLAFDVGVGKTYTGLAVLARARQEGWCRRPVILVPNSIVWKWEADIRRVLPDYRVAVIGSRRKAITRGKRKGQITSVTDTPAERAAKWTRFQAGEFDVVLLTYTALARTRMNEAVVREYARRTEAIQREVRLRQRNAGKAKKLTERQAAVLKEGVAAWVAEMMEIPESWEYDPGVAWDDIGIDLLIVDEAQNFKNLYLPESREGGVPRFMGNAGTGSKRAWQLDFRTAAVRRRTGGSGVVLLSATPAKNSPLEFYNLVQYIDHDAWSRMGIRDPEQFIDRYLRIELKPVVDTKMDVTERAAVTGFQNLHELRDVIFRYGEFKTAEDVGLRLPEPAVEVVEVDMSPAQSDKYDRYVGQIEAALSSTRPSDKAQILGLLARMSLVAIHADLDEGYTWRTAEQVDDATSPKFTALAARVLRNRVCGHIVFVDNVAAHRWVRQVLVDAGIPARRIAVLNAQTAKAAADRQRIALEFNGTDEDKPRYDVVIANAIAYEGIDLQRRTCAIHHLDLPWEPATLQQRNGRGVRQGNTLSGIHIYYYFARRSMDGLRFNLIQGKLGWMTELLRSQKRDTNNPGAQLELGPEEILLLVSRDPDKTRARLAEVKARREAEARAKVAEDAGRLLRSANARFRKAERTDDPAEAARLRLEAEGRLKDLGSVDPEAWPWARWMGAVRRTSVLVPAGGKAPVFAGLRVGLPDRVDPSRVVRGVFGRVHGSHIGLRPAGSARWQVKSLDELAALDLRPEHLDPAGWPDDDLERSLAEAGTLVESQLTWRGDWPSLGWVHADEAWRQAAWDAHGQAIAEKLRGVRTWFRRDHLVPVVGGTLAVGSPADLAGELLAPTDAGWRRFIELAPESGVPFAKLDGAAKYWWGRRAPRDLLARARRERAA